MGKGLTIHTQMGPAPAAQAENTAAKKKQHLFGSGCGRISLLTGDKRKSRRFPGEGKCRATPQPGSKGKSEAGDKLLRHTAVACALLMGIMAMRNADLPWTQRAVAGIERMMTMKIDLDESLGKLHFVRELVPETARVFWNAGASNRMQAPVAGSIEHEYSEMQPWRIYTCADGAAVYAAMDGEVARVEKGAMADYIVLITHDNGLETVYAYMTQADVAPGERVYAGDPIGVSAAGGGARLYFALLKDGAGIDPAEYE